jgi:hypothetical protein
VGCWLVVGVLRDEKLDQIFAGIRPDGIQPLHGAKLQFNLCKKMEPVAFARFFAIGRHTADFSPVVKLSAFQFLA